MKFNLIAEFNNIDDLVEFYNKVKADEPKVHFTTAKEIVEAVKQADFQSLADTTVAESAPTLPATQPKPAVTEPKFSMTKDEVKTYCTVARTEKGVNIKQILIGLGVGSFKELPDEKLEALYDAVKAARGD